MRIGIAYIEYSRRKGIERNAAELADRLADRGHEVHFHCATWMDAKRSKVRFHKVPTVSVVNSARISSFAILGRKSIQGAQYDVSHSHGGVVGCDVITAHSCHLAGIQLLKNLKGARIRTRINFGIADRIRLKIEHENYARRKYKKIIAVSEGVKREIIEYYKVPEQDITVIPNGVDLKEFNPGLREKFRESVRKRLGLSEDDFVLIFVANEFDRKGLEYIIRALPILSTKVKVLVAGGDNKYPYMRLAANLVVDKQVLFLGSVGNVAAYYAASDLFVFPTFYEAFSLATLEAAASGLPVLATRVNGTEELIQDGVNGYFISRDAQEIADRISSLMQDSQKLQTLGANARKSAENYSWDKITKETLKVYDEVVRMK